MYVKDISMMKKKNNWKKLCMQNGKENCLG